MQAVIYPRIAQTHYWSDSWDPDLYIAIARAGFICTSIVHPDLGAVLIPELQKNYAVLDWENLHCSRKVKKLMTAARREEDAIELRLANPADHVLDRLREYHGKGSWIHEPYQFLVCELAIKESDVFAMHGIELWSQRDDKLIAGELGYSIGSTYTSLSGFCIRDDPEWNHFGTFQQVLLARGLERRGYKFWNMGDASLPYKQALGARILPRGEFLDRWCTAREISPAAPLRIGDALDAVTG